MEGESSLQVHGLSATAVEGAGDIQPRLCLLSVLDYTAEGEAGRQLALCIMPVGSLEWLYALDREGLQSPAVQSPKGTISAAWMVLRQISHTERKGLLSCKSLSQLCSHWLCPTWVGCLTKLGR